MTPRRLLTPVFLVILFASAPGFAADRVQLSDGSVIFGTFKDADAGKVTFDTAFAGTLEIDQAEIVAMDVTSDLTLQMDDGEVFEAAGLTVADERLELEAPVPAGYSIEQLTRINPEPWELGNGYHWTGLGSLAFNSQRGNTELDELDYRLDSGWESLKDRFRLEAFGEVDEARGRRTPRTGPLRSRYDRMQTGDWYWGGVLRWNRTCSPTSICVLQPAPISAASSSPTRSFELEAEAVPAISQEDFISADDREYIGATWDMQHPTATISAATRGCTTHRPASEFRTSSIILCSIYTLALPSRCSTASRARLK
jgi:hypothetical protein